MTKEELDEIVEAVVAQLADQSVSLDDSEVVTSVNNAYLIPAFEGNGDKIVRISFQNLTAPMTNEITKAQAAIQSAKTATTDASNSATAATTAANQANQAKQAAEEIVVEITGYQNKIRENTNRSIDNQNRIGNHNIRTISIADYENPNTSKNEQTLYFCYDDE